MLQRRNGGPILSLLLVLTTTGPSCGEGSETPRDGLCPEDAPAGLELCASFGTLEQGLGETDVGGLAMTLEGDAVVVEGRVGPAVRFGSGHGTVRISDFSFSGQKLTVEAWVRPEGAQVKWATVADWWAQDQGFWLGGSTSPGGWEFWINPDLALDADGLVPDAWQHLAGVFDGDAGTLSLYVNGVEMERLHGIGALVPPPSAPLLFGAPGNNFSDFFLGTIDEVMVWSFVRTPEQICADGGGQWIGGSCAYDPPAGEPPGPCENVSCSGHGECVYQDGQTACTCEAGYHPEGLECIEDVDPCEGKADLIAEWLAWYLPGLEAGLETEVQAFVDDWESSNSAWDPEAEAWTAAAMLGLLHNSREVFCLGVLKAVEEDPDNPVALANAATCLLELGWGDDARQLLDCSLSLAPENAATAAGQAYHEYVFSQDVEAALEKYEEAVALDPANPEWSYQAIQLATQLGDLDRAAQLLPNLPGPSQGAPNGWRGTTPSEEPGGGGGFCCPCDTPTMYQSISECTSSCSANLGCFTGICAFTGTCQAQGLPFSFQLKLCFPPTGLQVCFTFDTNGNIGVQLGASLFNGFLGAGVGFTYNPFNKQVNIVADLGTSNLPINMGGSITVNPSTGKASASVGVGSASGAFSGQFTLLSN